MLPPDSVYNFKSTDPAFSLHFHQQKLYVGRKGKINIICLESLRSNYELKIGTHPIVYVSTTENQLITQQRTGLINIMNLTEKYGYVKQFEINNNYLGFAKGELHEERNLFAAPKDTTDIALIDIENGKEINLLKPEETAIKQITSLKMVTLSDGDLYILGGYESGHLLLWDLKTSSVISELLYPFPVTAIDYDLASNRGLLTGAGANIICGFGIERTSLQLSKKGGEAENIDLTSKDGTKIKDDFVNCIRIRPDKKCLVVGDSNGLVNIHSWKSLRKLTALKEHRNEITDVAFSNEAIRYFKSPLMALSSIDGRVSLWDIYYK